MLSRVRRRPWAISGAPPAISQVLWLCRSPWKVKPGRIGTVRTSESAFSGEHELVVVPFEVFAQHSDCPGG